MSAMDIWDSAGNAHWDFIGGPGGFTDTLADNSPWRLKDTSAAGAPTYVLGNTSDDIGALTMTMAADSEVENLCVYQGDFLQFDIDRIIRFEARLKIGASTFTSGSVLSFGLGSARNDTYTSMTALAAFSMTGATSTTLVYAETDDNVTDTAPVSTAKTLGTTYKTFAIDFTQGTGDVRFYVDGQPVATGTLFTMAGYTAGLQCYCQLSKAANTNVDAVTIDYFRMICRRTAR